MPSFTNYSSHIYKKNLEFLIEIREDLVIGNQDKPLHRQFLIKSILTIVRTDGPCSFVAHAHLWWVPLI